jgi:hypothetical protein
MSALLEHRARLFIGGLLGEYEELEAVGLMVAWCYEHPAASHSEIQHAWGRIVQSMPDQHGPEIGDGVSEQTD